MMDKTFDPASVEKRIAAVWQDADAFKAGRPERAGAAPYTIVIPPPNVTGVLHMGHALNNTLQDILCRFERMRGRDVLWQPGTDHAGIATQMVVERQLAERQEPNRHALGRDTFLERVWAWKAESGGAIVKQLKRLGASCDWSRERFTMDEGLSHAVTKVFVQLYQEGLIYKDKRLVNWDPKLRTAISDIEVEQIETKGHLWHFVYPVVDEAGVETGETITVATTRPETMLGDAAVAVHPDDERYTHLQGRRVRLPLVGRLIPIVADSYSDPEKGTGAVKITPAHDFNDFDVGRRHGLPVINVLDAEARLLLSGNAAFLAGSTMAGSTVEALHGLSREEARKRIVALMEEGGRLAAIEPHAHTVPHGDRSNVVIEPWLTDQWYVDAKTLAAPALAAVRDGRTRFTPANWQKTYFDWLDNIQPWCVSRQLWWGHRIPAWYGPGIAASSAQEAFDKPQVFVASALDEALQAARDTYDCEVRILDAAPNADELHALLKQAADDARAGYAWQPIWRDDDVLDTWFSSALWPLSTLGWPDETPELARHYPTNTLVTGFDIIFFWIARMMMMGLHFRGEVPFRDVYIHALVRDEKGAKMSKSKGNVLDPIDLVDRYGADALRFTLAAMAAQGRDIKLSPQRIEGYRNFATKIWNAARFTELNGCERAADYDPQRLVLPLNRWIYGETTKAIGDVVAALDAFRFNDAANAAYRFVWNIYCDWYLELAKPLLVGGDAGRAAETRATAAFVFDEILKLLHPFMPFLTEELWEVMSADGPPRPGVLALAEWPVLPQLDTAAADAEIGWVIELVSEIRSVRSEMNVPPATLLPLVFKAAQAPAAVRDNLGRWSETLKRLARLSAIDVREDEPASSIQLIVGGATVYLPLAGILDVGAERARLGKERDKAAGDARKLESKLANADFVARAPEEVVEENRERLADLEARVAKYDLALTRLAAL